MTLSLANHTLLKNFLLQNAYSCIAPGIAQGKAGIALAIFEMARKYRDDLLEDQAYELLQQALVYCGKNITFSNGCAGIGYVLLYLMGNSFIEADYQEVFGEQHRNILEGISVHPVKRRTVTDITEWLLFLEASVPYSDVKELNNAIEKLNQLLEHYYETIRTKSAGEIKQEEFYRCSTLLLAIYRGKPQELRWWEKIEKCYKTWLQQDIICESAGLGYQLIRLGNERQDANALAAGRQLAQTAIRNMYSPLMSLREKTNVLYYMSQSEEMRRMAGAAEIENKLVAELITAETKELEQNIVHSLWHKAFYCGLEGGVARLLWIRIYEEQLAGREKLSHLHPFFY